MPRKREKKTDKPKRQRFRSNVFHPKVKQPVTFELTEVGHKKLHKAMDRCQVSIGDLVEFMLRNHGDALTPEAFTAAR